MKNRKELIISADAVELSHIPSDSPACVHIGENTLLVTPERMTAIQAVNTLGVLTEFTADLIAAIKDACGTCEEQMEAGGCPYEDCSGPDKCPYETVTGPGVVCSAHKGAPAGTQRSGSRGERRSDGAGELFAARRKRASAVRDDAGEGLVCAADYEHDITDVPKDIRAVLAASGVCLGRLDEVIMGEKEVWHDR